MQNFINVSWQTQFWDEGSVKMCKCVFVRMSAGVSVLLSICTCGSVRICVKMRVSVCVYARVCVYLCKSVCDTERKDG